MEFRVLGPLEVARAGRSLPLGGYRQRLVLAALSLYPNRPVSTDWLVDAVWGDRPPQTARKTLQAYVSRLRGVLGSDVIVGSSQGYTLQLTHDALDAWRFEHLADDGQRLLETDPAAAGRALRSALGLWRGMPWGDLGDEAAILPEAQRLRKRRLAAVADRIAVDLALGRAAHLVGELEGLVEEYPWNERFRGQLMLALSHSGRQADALSVFRDTREFLGHELGIEPSAELRTLEEQILLQDPAVVKSPVRGELDDWKLVRNPYRGLRAFGPEDCADFFGRMELVDALVRRISDARFVALVGASGSGKSSAVMAGLLPRLPSQAWMITTMVPGSDPFTALRAALESAGRGDVPSLGEDLDDVLGLLRVVQSDSLACGGQLLLVIDQFEELFDQVSPPVRGAFVRNLVEAIEDPAAQFTVLVTLRADVLDRAMAEPRIADLIESGMVGVLPLRPHELEAAAARPAECAGVHVEPELLAELVADMTDQPGALPQFQYVLTQLFEERTGPVLQRSAYRRIGGLSGAVSRRAEEVYSRLGPEAQQVAQQVFMRLVTVGSGIEFSRRRVERTALEELDPGGAIVKDVLDAFDEARLLTSDRDPVTGAATVEVAHEALLREWPRMQGWLDSARQDLRQHAALVAEVAEWERSGRNPDYLLTGSRLDLHEDWRASTSLGMTEPEEAFLAAGVARRDEERAQEDTRRDQELLLERRSVRRMRSLVVVVSIAALVAAGLTLLAVNRSREAAAHEREARARELANAALVSLDTDPDLAVLLALEAVDVTRTTDGFVVREAEEALHEAVNAQRLLQTGPGGLDVAFLPDGSLLTGGDGAQVWNPITGNELRIESGEVVAVAVSPDGSLFATGGGRGILTVWDATSGEEVQRFARGSRRAHDRFIHDVVFSDDGALLASASGSVGGDQSVRVWDLATGAEVASVERPEGAMWDVLGDAPQLAFHPDGTKLAITGFLNEAARVLDLASGEWVSMLSDPGSPARGVRYIADGDRLVTSGAYGSISIWDTASLRLVLSVPLESEELRILQVDVSADETRLAATTDDGAIRVWNLSPGGVQPAIRLTGSGIAIRIAFSPDGTMLAGASTDEVQVWDITPGGRGEVVALEGAGSMTAFSPDGTRLAMQRGGDVVLLDTTSWELIATLAHPSASHDAGPHGVVWSPDGEWIATTTSGSEAGTGPGWIQLWDPGTGALVETLDHSLHPSGDIVISAGWVAASICGRVVEGVGWESAARVWDAASGEELFTVPVGECADAVDLDPTGRLLAVQVEGQEMVLLWDLEDGRRIGALPHHPGPGGAVRFAPDGRRLVSGGMDGTARVWDVTTQELLVTLEGHSGSVTQAIWSSNGRTIVTGGADGVLRLWDAQTGQPRLVLSGHRGGVLGLSVSPDGTQLASSGADGVVRVWAIDLNDLIHIAATRLSRTLTEAECATYHFDDCRASF